jgi:hypothetical protein
MISTWTFRESALLPGVAESPASMPACSTPWASCSTGACEKALVLDPASRKEIGEIAFGSPPGTAITAAAGAKLYVALTDSDAVAVVEVQQGCLLKVIDSVGAKPWAVSSTAGLGYCH